MNIVIPHNWLLDYIKTESGPGQIAEKLSLCSQSVEKIEQVGEGELYHIEITPNRYDCLSVLGIAREVAAVLPRFDIETQLQTTRIPKYRKLEPQIAKPLPLEVVIKDPKLCPRFSAIVLDNIKIKPSPEPIQTRLEQVGIRPLSNVVDVTNYLMVDLGQPMHIFDYDKIADHKMVLRKSRKGEKITTLDGVTRTLPKGVVIIEDGSGQLIDLCGIMGGANSEVSTETKRILLFVQIYDPVRIRKACRALAHRTDAASRFEKGIDPKGVLPALSRAVQMLQKNADARIASDLTDIIHRKYQPKKVGLDYEKIEQIIGVPFKKTEINQILASLGFVIKNRTVTVPSWRTGDITIPEDLAEEVARLYGYFNLPSVLPTEGVPIQLDQKKFRAEYQAKAYLAHQGFFEAYTNTATSRKILNSGGVATARCLKLKNPLSQEFEYLRTSLVPQLLEIISRNQNYSSQMRLFEMAHVYFKNTKAPPKAGTERNGYFKKGGGLKQDNLPEEQLRLTGIIADAIATTFHTTKVTVENLLEELGIREVTFPGSGSSPLGNVTKILSGKVEVGSVIQVNPKILDNFGIKRDVTVFDLDFEQLSSYVKLKKQLSPYLRLKKTYQPIPKFPPTIEDLSMIVAQRTPPDDLREMIEQCSNPKVRLSAVLIDEYQNPKFGKGKKSVAFRVKYQATDKTLRGSEVKKIREKVIKSLEEKHQAQIRCATLKN